MNDMKIQWLGHSCFKLVSDKGISIVTDPFDETVGYPVPEVEADIVTMSHEHFDHNCHRVIKGNPELVSKVGFFYVKDIPIKGIPTFHDDVEGKKRGSNIVYCFDIDGIHVCHCGDLGHGLNDHQIKEILPVDVLLIPVGGTYTIDATAAARVATALAPRIIIPMHFKTSAIDFPIQGVDPFLQLMGGGQHLHKNILMVDQKGLEGGERRVIVLDYE